ncbi:tail length tape measure protein [Vibrio phage K460]
MSDLKYGIAVEIKSGLSALKQFKQAAISFDKGRMAALVAQKNMLEQMKKLHDGMHRQPIKPPQQPSSPRSPYKDSTPEQVAYTKTQAALTKRLEREEKERTRIAVGQAKARMRQEQALRKQNSARIRQAVGGITAPSGSEGMRDYYRKLEKESLQDAQRKTREESKQLKLKQAQNSALKKAKETVMNSALMTEKEASAAQRAAQQRIRGKLATANTASEVRKIVAQERASLRLAKKKSFLVSRMEASSKEFAGNMVSAFAIASAGVFVTQTGQQFESARNTMLSVSEDAQEAGENMQFVKDEAFRLGLGLTQATKGFAKLAAARGKISLEDTKELFLGVSEASTLLGLSAEESNRALLAIQQINGLAS